MVFRIDVKHHTGLIKTTFAGLCDQNSPSAAQGFLRTPCSNASSTAAKQQYTNSERWSYTVISNLGQIVSVAY